jgi:hypothetical protein
MSKTKFKPAYNHVDAKGRAAWIGSKIKVAGPKDRSRTGLLVKGNKNVVNEALGADQHAGAFKSRKD